MQNESIKSNTQCHNKTEHIREKMGQGDKAGRQAGREQRRGIGKDKARSKEQRVKKKKKAFLVAKKEEEERRNHC